jgi:hypothetical protein
MLYDMNGTDEDVQWQEDHEEKTSSSDANFGRH